MLLPLATIGLVVSLRRTAPSAAAAPPLSAIVRAIWRPGVALALSGVGFAAITTFVPLLFLERGWSHAWLALTTFSIAFMVTRDCVWTPARSNRRRQSGAGLHGRRGAGSRRRLAGTRSGRRVDRRRRVRFGLRARVPRFRRRRGRQRPAAESRRSDGHVYSLSGSLAGGRESNPRIHRPSREPQRHLLRQRPRRGRDGRCSVLPAVSTTAGIPGGR